MVEPSNKIIGKIQLSPEEEQVLDQIDFDQDRIFVNRDIYLRNSSIIPKFLMSLIDRKAIPNVRLNYLSEPEYQSGGTRHSIIDRFEANGNKTTQKIMEHPNFLRHFKYLIFGSELPDLAKSEFKAAVDRCHGVNGSDALELGRLGRDLSERFGIEYIGAPEEFYKLALDCGVHVTWAQTIRDRMKSLKPRKNRGY